MLLQIFAIFDTAAEVYSPPFFQKSIGLALRTFSDTAQDASTTIYQHPQDFTLFHVGQYDDQTAGIEALKTPKPLIKANEAKAMALDGETPYAPLEGMQKGLTHD